MKATFASSGVVKCAAPARTDPGAVNIAVSMDGGVTFGGGTASSSNLVAEVHFRYLEPSFVTGLSPRSGPDTGGTVVTVLGTGFSGDFPFVCKFQPQENDTEAEGATAVAAEAVETTAVFLSSSELACIAPPVAFVDELAQGVDVMVYVDFGSGVLTSLPTSAATDSGSSTTFTYFPILQLTDLNPSRGPVSGGTIVDISGANFLPISTTGENADSTATTETVWCRFGTTVTIGSLLSDELMRCSSPPRGVGVPAEVEVSVSVNSGADFQGGPSGSLLVRGHQMGPEFSSMSLMCPCCAGPPPNEKVLTASFEAVTSTLDIVVWLPSNALRVCSCSFSIFCFILTPFPVQIGLTTIFLTAIPCANVDREGHKTIKTLSTMCYTEYNI